MRENGEIKSENILERDRKGVRFLGLEMVSKSRC